MANRETIIKEFMALLKDLYPNEDIARIDSVYLLYRLKKMGFKYGK